MSQPSSLAFLAVFPLSFLMLGVLGALDNISVVVRSTLILLRTPDEMRGRISAVNSVFVGSSNQLGGFESGLAAAHFRAYARRGWWRHRHDTRGHCR